MTPDEVIAMAREAGIASWHVDLKKWVYEQGIERFAKLVAAKEREACAKVCDHMVMYGPVAEVQQRYNKAYVDCRDAIRARDKAMKGETNVT